MYKRQILALIVLITWKICVSGTESKEDSVKNSTSFHVVSSSLDEEDTIIKSYFKNFNEKNYIDPKTIEAVSYTHLL